MEDPNTTEEPTLPSTTVMALSICFNIINHALITFVVTYMSLITIFCDLQAMHWHAWSCTVGVRHKKILFEWLYEKRLNNIHFQYQVLMLEGIMMFYSENVWSSQLSRPIKRCVHWIIQLIGSSLALSGVVVQFATTTNGPHFHTIHSTFGLIATIFLLISMCSGVFALKSFSWRKFLKPALVKCFHYVIGSSTVILGSFTSFYFVWQDVTIIFSSTSGLVALYFGYDKKFMQAKSNENIRFYLKLIAVSTAIFSLIGAVQSIYRQVKTMSANRNWNFKLNLIWRVYHTEYMQNFHRYGELLINSDSAGRTNVPVSNGWCDRILKWDSKYDAILFCLHVGAVASHELFCNCGSDRTRSRGLQPWFAA